MKKLLIIILLIIFFSLKLVNSVFCESKDDLQCENFKEYCYVAGYEGGKEDKELGKGFDPEEYYSLPLIQLTFLAIKEKLNLSYHEQKFFDNCCKVGFTDGYTDGYWGKPKKKSKWGYEYNP